LRIECVRFETKSRPARLFFDFLSKQVKKARAFSTVFMVSKFTRFSSAILLVLSLLPAAFATPVLRSGFVSPAAGDSKRLDGKFRPSEKSWKWADKQLKRMTTDEKIGQLVHIGINARFLSQDSNEFQDLKRHVTENKIGGIIVFVGGVYETVHLVNRMQELAKVPLLISADFETGVGMRFEDTVNFPWNMAVAAAGNPDFARRQGAIVAREAKALGIQQVFAPVVDVNNNADNPVINVRAYGENPADVARFAIAFTEGLQSGGVLATAKHFPGHGDTNVDSHRGLPVINVSRERLENTELAPFRDLIKAGVGSVMISHISLPQIDATAVRPLKQSVKASYTESEVITEGTTTPATLSSSVIQDILQKDLNFDGLIVTDAMDMSGLTLYFDQEEAAVRALLAGNDILLKPANADAALRGLKQAVATGRISAERLNQSVRKQLAWKHHLGLDKNKITPLEAIDRIVSSNETRQLTTEIAENAMTLVKNEENLLPLSPATDQRIFFLVITNSENPNSNGTAFLRVLRQSLQNPANIDFGVIGESTQAPEVARVVERMKRSDLVITGLYGRVRSGARNSVGLPEAGARVLRDLLQSDKPVVNISFGNPYLLKNFPQMKTYVVAYGDMVSLQRASVRAVLGEIDFKGKLPITIAPDAPRGTGIQLKAKN
jgi:beta-N-acetylhexosaminidase